MPVLAGLCCLVALLLLGLDSDRHHAARLGPRRGWPLRPLGWGLLLVGFGAAVAGWGWIFGPVVWLGLAMAGAGVSVLALNLLPIRLRLGISAG